MTSRLDTSYALAILSGLQGKHVYGGTVDLVVVSERRAGQQARPDLSAPQPFAATAMSMLDASIGRVLPHSLDGLTAVELRHAIDLLIERPYPSTWMVTPDDAGTYSLRLSRHSKEWLTEQLEAVKW